MNKEQEAAFVREMTRNKTSNEAGGKVNTSAIDGNGVYSTHGKD